jgi:hypothetical protein
VSLFGSVESIAYQADHEDTYNFEVADVHSYFVGNVEVWVHNQSVWGGGLTRVGRWMSKEEFKMMSDTGRVVEGAGGRTYVVRPPNPEAYPSARPGSVFAEFDVPTNSLKPASKPEWSVIPGPNVTTRMYGPAPAQMPPATCIVCAVGGPLP